MNIKKGFLGGFATILFIIIFTEIFGEDPITYFRYEAKYDTFKYSKE